MPCDRGNGYAASGISTVGTAYVQVSLFEGDMDSLKFDEDATVILVWTEMGMHVVIEESVPA
jgi:hypothetical protein